MDVSFSAKPQTLVSSLSLSPSSLSHFHLPSSIRREFLGCGTQLSPPGLRSRRTTGKLRLRIRPPRCLIQGSPYESSILVVAAAVATFAALRLVYLNYERRKRKSPEYSNKEFCNSIENSELGKQETDILKQEALACRSLHSESLYSKPSTCERENMPEGTFGSICSDEVHASDTKDGQQLKFQTSVLASEEILTNDEGHPGHELFAFAPIDSVLVKTGVSGSISSSIMVKEFETMEQVGFASKIPDLVPAERKIDVNVSSEPAMVVEPIFSCATPVKKKTHEVNQNEFELDQITTEGVELLASSCNGLLIQAANEVPDCNDEKQPEVRSVSVFKSLRIEPLQSTFQNKRGTYYQLKPSIKRVDVHPKGIPLSTEGRALTTCFKEGHANEQKQTIKVQMFMRDTGRSFMHNHDSGNLSSFPHQNRNHVKDANDPAAYVRTYNRLLRDVRLKDCIDLLESMERKGLLDMDKVYHSSFLKACKSRKAVQEALKFCKLIRKPTLSTFNMLLSVCASSQDFDGAFKVMLLVKEAGLKPDCKLYTTLISTCAKTGRVDAMFEIFHEMVNAGVEPNVNTYGALIDGCAKAGQVAKAFGAYGIMRSKRVQPDRVVFNALITACGQSGAVDRAFDVLAEMRAEPQPLDPDHVTVGALIKTCILAGQVERVPEVYKMLHQYNIKGTPYVYTIAVNSCSQTGDLELALSIYDDMKKNGVIPDEMFLSTLIDVAGHAGNVDAAFEILQDAKAKGLQLGNISYSSLMGACCNAKNWQKALELYDDIKASKLLPTVSKANALITSLCDGDQLQKSIEVLDEMKEAGLHPNIITYSILMVACEKKDEAEMGFMLLEQAKKDGILPNLIMCRCLTGLCLRSFEKACSLGEPIVTFNSGKPQIKSKWTSWAIKAYRETISAGVIPTIEVFSQVLGCLQFPRDSSLRDRFVENLGINFDASRCANICSLLDGFGEYDTRSFSVLEEAASLGVVPHVSFKESPIVVDARKLLIHTVEVYLLTILKGLKHRLAAGARLPNITILLPTEKALFESSRGERMLYVAGRVGQAVGSLLRRLGLQYQGDESYGKIRINGLTLRRWFKPNLTRSSIIGKPAEMIPTPTRLAKGITDQQRNIRSSNNLS